MDCTYRDVDSLERIKDFLSSVPQKDIDPLKMYREANKHDFSKDVSSELEDIKAEYSELDIETAKKQVTALLK